MTMQMPVKIEPQTASIQAAFSASTETTTPMVQIPVAQPNLPSPANQIEQKASSSDPFLQLVAQRLDQTSDPSKRRKLENAILEAMVLSEKE